VIQELRCSRSVKGLFADEMVFFRVHWAWLRRRTLLRVLLEDGVGLDRTTRIIRVAGSRLK
jgi:hypothetical protein